MNTRRNPINLDDDADDVPVVERKPRPRLPQADAAALAYILGFESREPAVRKPRRFTTGRNVQLNLKVTAETAQALREAADKLNIPQGAVLELALAALKKSS